MKVRALSSDERTQLLGVLRRRKRSGPAWTQAQIVLLSAQGLRSAEVAEALGTPEARVRDVVVRVNEGGVDWLEPVDPGGRPERYSADQRRRLALVARSLPADYGLSGARWSLRRLAEFAVAQGIVGELSHEGLRLLLQQEGIDLRMPGVVASRARTGLEDVAVALGQHVVQFYERDEQLADAVSRFLGTALASGHKALAVATPEHLTAFGEHLTAAGVDVVEALATGQYCTLDAAELLETFLVDGQVDAERFDTSVGAWVRELTSNGTPLHVYGEMVALLWEQAAVTEAMALEELWDALGHRSRFALLCAYPESGLAGVPGGVQRICDHHSGVVPEQPSLPDGPTERARRFEPTLLAPAMARRFVAETLRDWGHEPLVEAVGLVAGELASNAVRHAGSRFEVSLVQRPTAIRVAVTDTSARLPVWLPRDMVATSGRGVHLIQALSRRWGTELRDDGKTVWAELDLRTGPPDA